MFGDLLPRVLPLQDVWHEMSAALRTPGPSKAGSGGFRYFCNSLRTHCGVGGKVSFKIMELWNTIASLETRDLAIAYRTLRIFRPGRN